MKEKLIKYLEKDINWQKFILSNFCDDKETESKCKAKIQELSELIESVKKAKFES